MPREKWQGPLEKIDDYRWRIPMSYDRRMRVPGVIFADEKLLKDISDDQSLQQVANVAQLPGIVTASLAMPDIHWGYGFPIGGVAATDPKAGGVVSPGGVGFDINCLSGGASVLHHLGYVRTIAEIVEGQHREPVRCHNVQNGAAQLAAVVGWRRRRPTTPTLTARTASGRRITATSDHPFLTPSGMRMVGDLAPGDQVAINPFEGVAYDAPPKTILVGEADVCRFLRRQGKTGGIAATHIVGSLTRRGLLPLRGDSPALPALIKTLGVVFGDGTLYFEGDTGKGITWFVGTVEDLEDIRRDLAPWCTISSIYTRSRSHRIKTDYGEVQCRATPHECRVTSSAFAVLLALLGCPVGNKSRQDYALPDWLLAASLWQKRLFLAAYFGAALQTPRAYTERNHNFPCPLLTVQKQEAYRTSGRRWLEQIGALVKEFGVQTQGIEEHPEAVERKHGRSCRLRLVFSSRPESLRALFARIGVEYNRQKRAEAAVNAAYQAVKQAEHARRKDAITAIVSARAKTGYGAKRIGSQFATASAGTPVNLRFVERTIDGGGERGVRVAGVFPTYDGFRKSATKGLEGSGLIWEEIRQVDADPDVGWVYDITVAHPDHNFVANGFVVHNCGVRFVRTDLTVDEVRPQLKTLVATLFNTIPCGVGMHGEIRFSQKDAPRVMAQGSRWAVSRGYGTPDDLEHTESHGSLEGADPDMVSERAIKRGQSQLGTLGSGNHFLEVQVVETIYDETAARVLDLRPGQVTIMLHSGSRGFGYQICDDYLDVMGRAMAQYGIAVPDRQLACAPIASEEGQRYLGAIRCAANFAWANRQCLMHLARSAFERVFGKSWETLGLRLIYDVAHNIAKFERYQVNGEETTVCVHRKGATRAFPPGHSEIPAVYRSIGQPVIIPGDMGRNSFLLVGTAKAMEETFGTVCHGAGRVMSRAQAVREAAGRSIERELEQQGVVVMGRGRKGIAEEQPKAYKDVNDVVHVVHEAGLATRVARMKPLGVIKG